MIYTIAKSYALMSKRRRRALEWFTIFTLLGLFLFVTWREDAADQEEHSCNCVDVPFRSDEPFVCPLGYPLPGEPETMQDNRGGLSLTVRCYQRVR